jgi:hypothetical protein
MGGLRGRYYSYRFRQIATCKEFFFSDNPLRKAGSKTHLNTATSSSESAIGDIVPTTWQANVLISTVVARFVICVGSTYERHRAGG